MYGCHTESLGVEFGPRPKVLGIWTQGVYGEGLEGLEQFEIKAPSAAFSRRFRDIDYGLKKP